VSSSSQEDFLEKSYQSRAGNLNCTTVRSAVNELVLDAWRWRDEVDGRDVLSTQKVVDQADDEAVDEEAEEEERMDRLTDVDDNLGGGSGVEADDGVDDDYWQGIKTTREDGQEEG